jgi:acetyl esterase/lipase
MEYNINLENVFISGSSAGGHLAAAAGLAINNEEYKNIFSPKIKVKGVILYYPANGLPSLGNIEGDSKLLNPELLVQKNSPPCLIYQGTRDGMVPQDVAKKFSDKYYEQGNKNCTILWMALGSHGSDCYFPGNYNQVFLYYMERFMYINSI